MNNQSTPEKLRAMCDKLRRTNVPLADMIPLMQKAADELESMAQQDARVVPLTEKQRVYLAQAWAMLEDYAADQRQAGNDSIADGADASAHEIKLMLASPSDHAPIATEFLNQPPLDGEKVLTERIVALSRQDPCIDGSCTCCWTDDVTQSQTSENQDQPKEIGKVVVTWNLDRTKILAVTRQDEDGKILKVIAEAT